MYILNFLYIYVSTYTSMYICSDKIVMLNKNNFEFGVKYFVQNIFFTIDLHIIAKRLIT